MLVALSTASILFLIGMETTAMWTIETPYFVSAKEKREGFAQSGHSVAADISLLSLTKRFQNTVANEVREKLSVSAETVTFHVSQRDVASSVVNVSVSHRDPKKIRAAAEIVSSSLKTEIGKWYDDSDMRMRAFDTSVYSRRSPYAVAIGLLASLLGILFAYALDYVVNLGKSRKPFATYQPLQKRHVPAAFSLNASQTVSSEFMLAPTKLQEKSDIWSKMKKGWDEKIHPKKTQDFLLANSQQQPVKKQAVEKIAHADILSSAPSMPFVAVAEKPSVQLSDTSVPLLSDSLLALSHSRQDKSTASQIQPTHASNTPPEKLVQPLSSGVPKNLPVADKVPEYLQALMEDRMPSSLKEGAASKIEDTKTSIVDEPSEEALKERLNKLLKGEL